MNKKHCFKGSEFDNIFSVIGIGFGDEGKGSVVDYLASNYDNSVVIRHSGGHQVGHTVGFEHKLHEFRQFGSGTFRNVPTVWDKNCTVSPLQFEIEYKRLQNIFNITPTLYCSNLCPIVTLFDIAYNRAKEAKYLTGSVGVGFAATLRRTEIVPLYVIDLFFPYVLELKIFNIRRYYMDKSEQEGIGLLFAEELTKLSNSGYDLKCFLDSCAFFINNIKISENDLDLNCYDNIIFEGNQGILLDKFHGFYPNVTYGHTTNANVECDCLKTYYVSRCYATRHGAGPLKNENLDSPVLINTECEQNHLNPWQGNFRTALLDYDLVKYAINCDKSYMKNIESNLVITCIDQFIDPKITVGNKVSDLTLGMFSGSLADNIFYNESPNSETIKKYSI